MLSRCDDLVNDCPNRQLPPGNSILVQVTYPIECLVRGLQVGVGWKLCRNSTIIMVQAPGMDHLMPAALFSSPYPYGWALKNFCLAMLACFRSVALSDLYS